MGSDSRDVGNGRSDVLMVMHRAADRKCAHMISCPRDMYVPIPGHGRNKINAAFGGPALTVRTLEGLLNSRMDHVALIDFEGFINLTEELGGVTVYNKYASNSGGYKFPVGDVSLRGEQALAYVRERKQLPRGDLDRAERQRAVLQAIWRKGSPGRQSLPCQIRIIRTRRFSPCHRRSPADRERAAQDCRFVAPPPEGRPHAPSPHFRSRYQPNQAEHRHRRQEEAGSTCEGASERPDGRLHREVSRGIEPEGKAGDASRALDSRRPSEVGHRESPESMADVQLCSGPCVGGGELCLWQSLPFSSHSTRL
jgi:LCP family protein required for cell wall assembly